MKVFKVKNRPFYENAGFGKTTAGKIGEQAQGPDGVVEGNKINTDRSAYAHGRINEDNMEKFHFVFKERLVQMEMDGQAAVNPDSMKTLGEFLHAQEDTYAHSSKAGGRDFHYYGDWFGKENGGHYGHGIHANNPDQTWRDKDKAMAMARRVFRDMKLIHADPNQKYPGTEDPTSEASVNEQGWEAVRPTVEKFVMLHPHVIRERLGYDEQVTFGGYNEKIHVLDTSYGVNPAYGYDKVNNPDGFPLDVGYVSGQFWSSKMKSIGNSIGNIGSDIGSLF